MSESVKQPGDLPGKISKQKRFIAFLNRSTKQRNAFLFCTVFAVIGVVLLLVSFAATISVTYKGVLSPTAPQATYKITTGSGQMVIALVDNSKDMIFTVKNKAGTKVGSGYNYGYITANGTVTVSPDTYTIVVGYNRSTKLTTKKAFTLNISYPSADSATPVTVLTAPTSATLSGVVKVGATATDDVGVTKVEFYANNTMVGTTTTAPYSANWDTKTVANGNQVVSVKAYDATGNVGVAASTVTVDNTTSTAAGYKYEAEAADTTATVITSGKEYASGGAVLGNFGNVGQYVTFNVCKAVAGPTTMVMHYASAFSGTVNSGPNPLPRSMIINGGAPTTVNFPRTTTVPDNWNSISTTQLGSPTLNAGKNTVSFRIDANDYQYWDVDYLEASSSSECTTVTPPTVCPTGQTGTPPNCVTPPVLLPVTSGVGGSGLNMTPGRKCAGTVSGVVNFSGGDLNGAVANLPNGGTLMVNGGNYGNVNIGGRTNITVCGKPGTRPIVNSNGGNGFLITDSSNVHVEGFEVIGNQGSNESGIRVGSNAQHIHVWDNWVHGMGSTGIGAANGYCGHVDFRYNRIWDDRMSDGYHPSAMSVYEPRNCGNNTPDFGIYTDSFIGNVIFNNGEVIGGASDGNCIEYDDTLDTQGGNQTEGPYYGRLLAANNVCVSNGGRGVHIGPSSARADVVNNTNYHNFNQAFSVPDANDGQVGDTDGGYRSDDVRFVNNVAIGRSGKNGFDAADGSNLAASNNIFYPVSRDGGLGGGFRLIADPGFVNANDDFTAGDFRPRSGSPMISAGVGSYANVAIPNVDVLGKTRSTSNPSIGAYEP
jgi:hypothetical protein